MKLTFKIQATMEHVIKFEDIIFWKDEKDILYCKSINSESIHNLDIHKAKLYIKAIIELSEGKPMPFLIDLRNSRWTFSILAAKELSNNPKLQRLRISEAFVANTIAIELLIKSYKRLFDSRTPFKIFRNLETAKYYCKQVKYEFYGSI